MPILNKSSIFFVLLNLLRFLSVVAICLTFSGQVVTIVSDLRTVQSAPSSSSPSPTSTAATNIFRRSDPDPDPIFIPTITSAPVLERREPASLRELDTTSATMTSVRKSTRTSTTRAITATNEPSPSSTPTVACAYVSSTSIPTQPGGSLFSTLSRIFCCLILVASLLSELPPPITTKAGRLVERWWNYAFPPFGRQFGTGVLGGVQVFMGCTVLSHAVAKFTQVAAWFIFCVGILNLLCGLAFGSRLKVIRSPFADSTSPSALRKLRLESSSSKHETSRDDDDEGRRAGAPPDVVEEEESKTFERARQGADERRKWYRFDNASQGGGPEVDDVVSDDNHHHHQQQQQHSAIDMSSSANRTVRFTPLSGPKRSLSRNGPNGIVISAPIRLRGGGGAAGGDDDDEEDDEGARFAKGNYGEMEEVRNGASSRASSRARGGGGGVTVAVPPPVYSGRH